MKVVSKLEDDPEDEKPCDEELEDMEQDEKEHNEEAQEDEKVIRKSTRTSLWRVEFVFVLIQPIQRKKVGEEKRMSQAEMFLEAAQIDIMNLRNLERVLAREEEVKKKAIVHKAVYKGPQIQCLVFLKLCSSIKHLLQIHGQINVSGLQGDSFIISELVRASSLSLAKDLTFARTLLLHSSDSTPSTRNMLSRGYS
ncbi:unnamed protein product [Cochlearia groenlandica]